MAESAACSLADFIARLPKTETHLHIEGALPWELLRDLEPTVFSEPPASWADGFRFTDFAAFERDLLHKASYWFTTPERYYEAAVVLFKRMYAEHNVRYIETSFASGVMEHLGLDGAIVAEAIKSAAPRDLPVKVFMGIHHNGYTERSAGFIEEALSWEHLDGFDLHGTETLPLEPWTADLWQRARVAGKLTKAHAGEFAGPEFVWQVVEELGVSRIQHGVRAVESAPLLERLKDRDVVFDMCPISNLKLGVVPTLAEHPIRQLHDAGFTCTVSTDDPLSFGNTVNDEYRVLYERLSFNYRELGQIAANGFRLAGQTVHSMEMIEQIAILVDAYEGSGA
jgi:adenosine deaminase